MPKFDCIQGGSRGQRFAADGLSRGCADGLSRGGADGLSRGGADVLSRGGADVAEVEAVVLVVPRLGIGATKVVDVELALDFPATMFCVALVKVFHWHPVW